VSKYTTTIFAKLGIHADDNNRRVPAVLTYLDGRDQSARTRPTSARSALTNVAWLPGSCVVNRLPLLAVRDRDTKRPCTS
jgi:hypothetical protein